MLITGMLYLFHIYVKNDNVKINKKLNDICEI